MQSVVLIKKPKNDEEKMYVHLKTISNTKKMLLFFFNTFYLIDHTLYVVYNIIHSYSYYNVYTSIRNLYSVIFQVWDYGNRSLFFFRNWICPIPSIIVYILHIIIIVQLMQLIFGNVCRAARWELSMYTATRE